MLDLRALGHRQRHTELREEIECELLLEVEHLLELVCRLRRALDPARRDVDHRGVHAEIRDIDLQNGALHHASGANKLAGAHIRRRIGGARLLQLDLVDQRLHPRPLHQRELR